jgi:hypothetical protein
MKTIVVVQGKEKIGKTPAIKEVFKELRRRNWTPVKGPFYIGKEKDIEVELELELECEKNEKRIGISSMGDPQSDLFDRLKDHTDKCEVILTASRTRSTTVAEVEKIADEGGYDIIWTRHFHHEGGTKKMPNGVDLNKQFAPGMVDLILSLL